MRSNLLAKTGGCFPQVATTWSILRIAVLRASWMTGVRHAPGTCSNCSKCGSFRGDTQSYQFPVARHSPFSAFPLHLSRSPSNPFVQFIIIREFLPSGFIPRTAHCTHAKRLKGLSPSSRLSENPEKLPLGLCQIAKSGNFQ